MNQKSPLHIKEAAYEKQNRKMRKENQEWVKDLRLEQALEECHLHADLQVWPGL